MLYYLSTNKYIVVCSAAIELVKYELPMDGSIPHTNCAADAGNNAASNSSLQY